MKKTYNIILIFIIALLFVNKIEAKKYNYSCDYSFTAEGTGETIRFRIKVKDLDESYIKGKDPSYWESQDFWKEHVSFMPYKDGQYIPFVYTWANSGKTEDFDGRNKNGCKSLWTLNPFGQMPDFVERSVDLEKNDIVCPSYRVYRTYDIWPDNNSCIINNYNEDPRVIVDYSPETYDETGRHTYPNPLIKTEGLNCYKEDGVTAVRCDSVTGEEGIYDHENEKTCKYSGNSSGLPYFLIYNNKDETLRFDDNNWGYTINADTPHEERDGYIYLTDSSLIDKFKTAFENDKCPSSVRCDCGWKIEVGLNEHWGENRGTECHFNNRDVANGNCGLLMGEDGEELEDPGHGEGTKPGDPSMGFGGYMTCAQILGPNLTKVVRAGVKAIQIVGAIVAIVWGMITLIPAIIAKDAEGLKKAEKKLVLMAIILLCIFLLPYFARWIGSMFDYDISCLF